MKNGYKTVSALKKECSDFADKAMTYDFSNLSEEELKTLINKDTNEYEKIAALISEVIFRKQGLRLFKCQLETAAALLKGHIAELPTGEGKTLSAVVAAIIYAKACRTVHILVFNDYLARRDAAENRKIFEFCGVSVNCITEKTSLEERKSAYESQVLYIPAREAGYDCIRNFVAGDASELLGEYDVAIIDEADSILIDEAAIPLVLAGKAENTQADELKLVKTVKALTASDYEISEQDNSIWLTDSGIAKVEELLFIENLYDNENVELLSGINTALQAVYFLKKDKDYIVKENRIAVIDESTGRIAVNRKFPGILHKFVEAKEGITDNINTKIYSTMTIGAFLEQYKTLAGMTGTAATSASELESSYQLRTIVIEPHTPCIREDLEDEVFETNKERDSAVIAAVIKANSTGRPVLIGTSSVKESEELSRILNENQIKHSVLNARNDEAEANIISTAGAPYSVTVSTNMAGRGVDIKLGGANEEEKDFVSSTGGLFVISTSVNRSRRIDNQLKGRAGRQGDVGASKFFISLEDENIAPFFDEELKNGKNLSAKEKFALVRSAQKTLEGNDAEARYTLKKYSYIIEHQRKLISNYRRDLLLGIKTPDIAKELDYDFYIELEKKAGKNGVELAETELSLYYINQHFAAYLEAMEEVKSGIHLCIVAGKNPFDEFNRTAISAFEEMNQDIRFDVLEKLHEYNITENGIDADFLKIGRNTGTWTYMVDDSTGQFSHLPELMNIVTNKIKKHLSFGDRFERFLNRKKEKKS